ncbi:hypothetical protein [Mesomycoplasma neurolyticum]|nr:hypothetical protein [Mesomycoplasma neurolyticum]
MNCLLNANIDVNFLKFTDLKLIYKKIYSINQEETLGEIEEKNLLKILNLKVELNKFSLKQLLYFIFSLFIFFFSISFFINYIEWSDFKKNGLILLFCWILAIAFGFIIFYLCIILSFRKKLNSYIKHLRTNEKITNNYIKIKSKKNILKDLLILWHFKYDILDDDVFHDVESK